MSMLELTATEQKLANRIDNSATRRLAISDHAGGIGFADMNQVMEFSKLLALSNVAVPKHLRGNVGACLAVCIQAIEWQMSPYAVANKSYSVNDRLSFEAQLIEAVILRRAPIKGRPKIEYVGDGGKRVCRVWAELRDEPGEVVEYKSPEFDKITPKNSPLWKADPDQQQFYYSVRAWCRRHFPDILLGVYARDEIEDHATMTTVATPVSPATLSERLDALAQTPIKAEEVDNETGEISTAHPTAQATDAAPAEAEPPKTSVEYALNAREWIQELTDADAGEARWKSEKGLRAKLNLVPGTRDILEGILKEQTAALRAAAKEEG